MLKEMIEKIVSLAETKTFDINGQTYSDKQLTRIAPHVDRPKSISVSGLDSICKLVRKEIDRANNVLMVSVDSYKNVSVFTSFEADFSRNYLYTATSDSPGMRGGYRSKDEVLIELRSLFIPNEGSEYLLDLLSRMTQNNDVTSNDNGVTQNVVVNTGVTLKSVMNVKPRVALKPFRTFSEVAQPESEFLVRVSQDCEVGLFEADGGIWKLEAKRNVAAYFEKELSDLINDGKVVVMI